MMDFLLSGSLGETLTLTGTLAIIGSALCLGLVISLVYMATHKKEVYAPGFTISLIMLPAIISMIILLIGNNVARAFSLAGAFSLIRFRSAPGDAKDISYVFFSLGVGLSCGMGYIGYALLFTAVMCVVMAALTAFQFGMKKTVPMQLRIILPEDMDYYGVFDEVLSEYTDSNQLIRVKTAEFGSLFELTYDIVIKDIQRSKSLIDKLRCKNGNLTVSLSLKDTKEAAIF